MAAAAANPYEELRRRQVEENKRKIDELRLLTLSAAVFPPTKPPRNPRRPRNPKLDAPIRRSGRIADLPEQPVYPTPKARRSNLRAVPAYAISKAQELKGHPTFVIPMSRDSAPKNNRLVDAFAAEAFKGNPAAVCLLENAAMATDERWLQAVAAEFNLPMTAFLLRDGTAPRFQLRWFTPITEVALCGHATLASAHFLLTSVLADHDSVVEFATRSGILTAKKVPAQEGVSGEGKLFIELDFPMIGLIECPNGELPSIPKTLNGASIVSVHKSATPGDLIVELSSGKEVADIIPDIHEIEKCSGRGVIVTGPAPAGSGYDFFTPFFYPKCGIDEDPVCGSAHCVLAPYWGGKLGKQKMTAFQASPRGGILYLELEAAARRVRIQGEAVTVMTGTLLA